MKTTTMTRTDSVFENNLNRSPTRNRFLIQYHPIDIISDTIQCQRTVNNFHDCCTHIILKSNTFFLKVEILSEL